MCHEQQPSKPVAEPSRDNFCSAKVVWKLVIRLRLEEVSNISHYDGFRPANELKAGDQVLCDLKATRRVVERNKASSEGTAKCNIGFDSSRRCWRDATSTRAR